MIIALLLLSHYCNGMQQAIIDGPHIFYRDITVKEYARYTIVPPSQKNLILPENWLALDKESQVPYHAIYNLLDCKVGHERYKFDKEQVTSDSDTNICTFISGEEEARNFDINDYLMYTGNNNKRMKKFDGVQMYSDDKEKKYYWLAGEHDVGFVAYLHESRRDNDHKSDRNIFDCGTDMNVGAYALKFPYTAYCAKHNEGNCLSIINHRSSIRYLGSTKQPLKKLSWLQGENLLGLTESGDVVTIGADDLVHQVYQQNFGDKKFIDIAVDMKHPWRFIGLTTDFDIIYADFSSHQATLKKEHYSLLFKQFSRLINYWARKKVFEEKMVTMKFNSKKTYRTIMQLPPVPESKMYKIWFHNDKIGVYCGEKNNTNGTFDIYKLHDRIFAGNMHDIYDAKNKATCIDTALQQLDCH